MVSLEIIDKPPTGPIGPTTYLRSRSDIEDRMAGKLQPSPVVLAYLGYFGPCAQETGPRKISPTSLNPSGA